MQYRNIRISSLTYDKLAKEGRFGESFDKLLRRLIFDKPIDESN